MNETIQSASEKFKVLSERDHVLVRSGRYVGSMKAVEEEIFVFDEKTERITRRKVSYIPALIKIFREVIDNSVDEAIRTKFEFANKIDIWMQEDGRVVVWDNGRGIPVVKKTDDRGEESWIPEMAWCKLRAGSNFGDESDNTTIGMHGEGVTLTNIFSKDFLGETCDGKNRCVVHCENNLSSKSVKVRKSDNQYTKVTFLPDYERFGVSGFDGVHMEILRTDIMNLAVSYPQIRFRINGHQVKFYAFKNYVRMYAENFEVLDTENFKVGVFSSENDDFGFVNFVNGINVREGGNPLNWAVGNVVYKVKDLITKKYPNIKPGDVKNKLSMVVFFFNMPNPRFGNQVKSLCINTIADFGASVGEVDFESFAQRVFKNQGLVDPIIEVHRIKEELQQRQHLKNLNAAGTRKVRVEKHIPATKELDFLVLTEGDSACGSIAQVLGREKFGYFPLRGKPLNCLEVPISRVAQNEEVKSIIQILGLDITKEKQEDLSYSKVMFATDQDLDGISIRGLLLAFFHRFVPDVIKSGKVCFLRTPLIAGKRKGKIEVYFFSLGEYKKYCETHKTSGLDFHYYKGLGTWKKEDLRDIIDRDGIDNFIVELEYDAEAPKLLSDWLGHANANKRQDYLRGKSFDIGTM